MGRWPIAGVALSLACSATEAPVFLDLAPLERELVVLASLDDRDRIVETTVIDWDATVHAAVPVRTHVAVPSGGRLVGAAFDRRALEARSPRLDPSRLSELVPQALSPDGLSCVEGVLRPAERRAQVRWPDDTRAFEWLSEEERRVDRDLGLDWWSRVSPAVMVEPNHCAGHPEPRFQPFSPRQPIIDSDTIVDGERHEIGDGNVTEFIRVDERWVLLAYAHFVVLAERGIGYVDAPGRYLMHEPGWRFRSIAIGLPDPETGTRRLVLVAASGPSELEATGSRVWDASLGEGGLVPGRLLFESEEVLDAIYIVPDSGRLMAFERPAQIYLEDTPGGTLLPVGTIPGVGDQGFKRGRFEASGLPARPVALIGARANAIYLGTLDGGDWLNLQDGLSLGLTLRGFTTVREPDGEFSLYAGNTAGHVFQRKLSDANWSLIEARLDPELMATECAVASDHDTCGFARAKHSWQHFTVFADERGERALLGLSDLCSVAFVIRPDGCTSSFRIEGLGPIARGSDDEILGARHQDGFVTLVTELGSVFEISSSELGLAP